MLLQRFNFLILHNPFVIGNILDQESLGLRF